MNLVFKQIKNQENVVKYDKSSGKDIWHFLQLFFLSNQQKFPGIFLRLSRIFLYVISSEEAVKKSTKKEKV